MLFNSYVFLFGFLPLLLVVYYGALKTVRQRNAWLTVMSYVFYGWWSPVFCLLMFASTASDYFIGKQLSRTHTPHHRKMWLVATVAINLSALGFFKYYNFLAASLLHLTSWMALPPLLPSLNIILPIGISFYTFESLSYTIDIYRGEVKPADSFAEFLCFISLFPHLIAGPIMRYADLDRQLRDRVHSVDRFMLGTVNFAAGLVKKLAIADSVAPLADFVFAHHDVSPSVAWLGALAYAVQIYFDFSAYSDMAYGLGLMIGFDLIQNFDSPYQAVSIQDFWRRWHISLSTWLRDYLYVPLGGNRNGRVRTYINLIIVMLLGGLWHGASWTFVVWGLYHGVLLAIERLLGDLNPLRRMPRAVQRAVTFFAVLVGWVFFRSINFEMAARVLGNMFGHVQGRGLTFAPGGQVLLALSVGLLIAFFTPNLRRRVPQLTFTTAFVAGLAISFALIIMGARAASPFLYFQF